MSASFDYGDFELVPRPRSDFDKIFQVKRGYLLRKTNRYGGHLRFHHDGSLDRETALHWILHHKNGAALRDRLNLPADEVADLLVRAAQMHPTTKRNPDQEESDMTKSFDAVSFAKRVVDDGVSAISEQQATELIQKYASDHRLPNEKPAAAFARIFSADDDIGLSFRKMVTIAKGHAHPHVGA